MNPRRFPLLVILICTFMVFYATFASNAEQSAPPRPPLMQKDAPYHPGGEVKPETKPSKVPAVPVAAHNAYPPSPLSKIEILPSAVEISGSHYNQRLVVEGTFADGHQEDLTPQSTLTVSNPKVAQVSNDFAEAQGNGQATVTATFHGRRASVPIGVQNFTAPALWSFRNDVQPVLTKMGCNSGPCHGATAGKNGFKLSLRGYDHQADYVTLTHQSLARRTERMAPSISL